MIRKILVYIHILGFLVFGFNSLNAQEKLVKEVKVVKPYEPTISDAYKLTHLPKITDTVKTIPEIKYILQTKPMNVGYTITPIKPAKMVGEPLSKLYNSYVKVGLGTKMLPMLEAYVNNKRSKDYSIGAYYKFLNSIGQATFDNDEKEFAGASCNSSCCWYNLGRPGPHGCRKCGPDVCRGVREGTYDLLQGCDAG